MATQRKMLEDSRAELDSAWKAKHPNGRFLVCHITAGTDEREPKIWEYTLIWQSARPTSWGVSQYMGYGLSYRCPDQIEKTFGPSTYAKRNLYDSFDAAVKGMYGNGFPAHFVNAMKLRYEEKCAALRNPANHESVIC